MRALRTLVLPLILLQAVLAFAFLDSIWNRASRNLVRHIAHDVILIADSVAAVSDKRERDTLIARLNRESGLATTLLPGQSPEAGNPDENWFFLHLVRRQLTRTLNGPYRLDSTDYPHSLTVILELPGSGLLRITFPGARLPGTFGHVFLLWILGTTAAIIVTVAIFLNRQIRPLRRLARQADAVGRNPDPPVLRSAPDDPVEIRQVADAFRHMSQRLIDHLHQRTRMLSAVSHDLRTPLTRMTLEIELLHQDPDGGIARLQEEIRIMNRMITGYLDYARGQNTGESRPVPLAPFLKRILGAWNNAVTTTLSCPDNALAVIRPEAITRCLDNLLANAARYGKAVAVTVVADDRQPVTLTVDDDGPGIPVSAREHVFTPFHRLDEARPVAADGGGSGLGLTICRDIIHAHGGRITLETAPTGGLRVRITLPSAPQGAQRNT